MRSKTCKTEGFSLLELAVTVTITAIMLSISAKIVPNVIDQAKYSSINSRLQTIQSAIDSFYAQNGYIPCPSSLSANYGAASPPYIGISGACTGTAPSGINSINSGVLWVGGVPTQTLNIPDLLMYDPWDNRIEYAVVTSLAQSKSLYNAYINNSSHPIIIVDTTTAQINTDTLSATAGAANLVAYVLISHGKDGSGATSKLGATTSCPSSSNNLDKENCNGDQTYMDSTYNPNTSKFYDDVIRWKTNQQGARDGRCGSSFNYLFPC